MDGDRFIGSGVLRREDERLLRGAGRFVDDLDGRDGVPVEDCSYMAVVRSPVAHARVLSIDVSGALRAPGVRGVVTGADLSGTVFAYPLPTRDGSEVVPVALPLLAGETVRFVGEPVALVLAESRAAAEDAIEQVVVDYDPLDPVVTIEQARAATTVLHAEAPDNGLVRWSRRHGDPDAAFAAAARVVRGEFAIPRLVAAPIEVRGCVAAADGPSGMLTLWASAQDPHRPRAQLAALLGRDPETIRVVVPEVGGAFGSKGSLPPEYALAAWCALRDGRPVKWIETRSENFLGAYQGRGMAVTLELACDPDGRFLALRAELAADIGAYLYPNTANVMTTAAMLLSGCYDIPVAEVHAVGYATNKVPTGPYRGAGRPEAAYFIERAVDLAADALGLDPVEIRRRNFIGADAFPYESALGFSYDSGDYAAALDRLCELLRYDERRAELGAARAAGRVVGLGVGCYIERAAPNAWEGADATVAEDGHVVVRVGSSAHGQGHETAFAQVAADHLGLGIEAIEVRHGDSADGPPGVGTYGSRSITLGGSAVLVACDRLLAQARALAAAHLGAAEEELDYRDGVFADRSGGERVDLAGLAGLAARRGERLFVEERFRIDAPVFPFGAYGAVVEIDPETGALALLELVAVDDAGVLVNPLLAEGQVIGSSIQGIGASLLEEVVYDPDGQPLSASFVSYGIPSAAEIGIEIKSAFQTTPSPRNPLGAKGIGEAGTIGVPAAIGNAVADALSGFGVANVDPPYSPERLWRLLAEAPGESDR